MKINIKKTIPLILILISALFLKFFLFNTHDNSKQVPIHSFFSSDTEYFEYIKNNVTFNTINLNIINVQKGDNFWKIAKKYGINIDTLISANPFWNSLIARVNQQIIVPSESGVLHFIENLDEIDQLVLMYKTDKKNVVIQTLPFFYKLYYKFLLDKHPIAVFIKQVKPTADLMNENIAKQFIVREMFRSPLGGRYSSLYGRRVHPIFRNNSFHNGVDIATPYGTAVGAAREGTVVGAGWMGGYGKAVIIEHPEGYRTLYGHLSTINVRIGAQVKAGRFIGRVGSTGLSTGPHLHFTIWHQNKLLNPLNILW